MSNIDEHTLNRFITECDKIKTFIDTANIEIPRKYWRGEINQLTNSISGLQQFIMRFQNEWGKSNTWINGEIQKRTLPEIHYVCEVFGLNNTDISTTDKLLKLMEITDETINKPAYELHTRVDEMKLMFCKIVQLCSDIQNDYIEIDRSFCHKPIRANQSIKKILPLGSDKRAKISKIIRHLKKNYTPEQASQLNEFLSEVRIAIAIAKAKPEANVECDYTTPESGIGKTDADFKIGTDVGSILMEITSPRKSDFIKDHTFYEAHNSGELGITLSKSAYKEFPEYIKAKNVILNKCQKNGVPIKFPELSKETLNVIVVFENSALGYLDHHDYIEVFLSSNSKNPGLLFGIDDATKIFQERIDCVCFIKNFNESIIIYNPWIKNTKLQDGLESILREVGIVKVISIQDLLIKFAHCVRSKREQLCLTQQQLADLCGVECTFIENIERGDVTNNQHSFFRVLQMLRIDLNTIKD